MIIFYQDCSIYEIGRDGYGKPKKKNVQYVKCRVKEKYQLVKNNAAQEIVSKLEITVGADIYFNLDDTVEYEGNEYSIISYKITRNTIGEVVRQVIYL